MNNKVLLAGFTPQLSNTINVILTYFENKMGKSKLFSNLLDYLSFAQNQKRLLFFFTISLFSLVFVLNWLYPLYADDWGYFYANREKINIFADILHRQYNQYLSWGGRSVVHSIAHFLLWLGSPLNDIVNTVAYTAYIYYIYLFCNKGKPVNAMFFLLLGLFLWFIIPALNSTILWIVGSANYLWGTLIVLTFMYPYYSYYTSEKQKNSYLKTVLFFFFGILAGWTNENMFVALAFFVVGLFYLLRRNKLKIPAWAIAGFIGVCIGGIIMIAAPGNYIRANTVNEALGLADKSVINNILYRIMKTGYRYLVYILPLTAFYSIVFLFYRSKLNKDKNKAYYGSLLFFLSGHVACFAMAGSAIFPERALFGIITLLVTSLGILYNDLNIKESRLKYFNLAIISVILFSFSISYFYRVKNINFLSEKFKERETYLTEQKENDNNDIIFYDKIVLPDKYNFEDLSDDPEYWLNKSYAKFHGINSVKINSK